MLGQRRKRGQPVGWRFLGGRPPTSSAIDESHAKAGCYYLERRHGLIHRHLETMSLNSDQTAVWSLAIDLELPNAPGTWCGTHNNECLFLFPLLFLRKADRRTGFDARREDGMSLPLLTRAQSNWVSSVAAARAAANLQAESGSVRFAPEPLQERLLEIARDKPYDSSVGLERLLREVRARHGGQLPGNWEPSGFTAVLRMLAEHSLAWVTLSGRPGQRRIVTIEHDIELVRRPFVRWRVGSVEHPEGPCLDTGEKLYGRRGRRISLGVLGERLSQPLAWMPIEFEFPTIYARRCRSYHFELHCPPGLSPRELKIDSERPELPEGASAVEAEAHLLEEREARPEPKLEERSAYQYLPGSERVGDVGFRATVGVGSGAFPILWTLAASVTALLLWALAATDPHFESPTQSGNNEITAGILLVIPALLGALVIGAEERSVSQLLSGARILLLVSGLSAVAGAGVLIGATPLGLDTSWTWTVCAIVATVVTVPLAASWLLSTPSVWQGMKALRGAAPHYALLVLAISIAIAVIIVLEGASDAPGARILAGILLLLLTVTLMLLANNRAGMKADETRYYAAVSLVTAAIVCLALGCVELRAAIDYDLSFQRDAELLAMAGLLLSPLTGPLVWLVTRPFGQKGDEIHLSPALARALLGKERMLEFVILRQRERRARGEAPTGEVS